MAELAKRSKIAGSQIYEYLNGEKAPGLRVLSKLCEALNADANDLLGVGGQFVPVSLYPEKVSGGHGREIEPTEEATKDLHFRRDWLEKKNRARGSLGAFAVEGSSMAPHVAHRDIVLFDKSQKTGEGVFVVRVGGALSVKRVQPQTSGEILLWGKDDLLHDKLFDKITPADLKEKRAEIVGRVFWRGGEV